jgi:hypothetical protein
LQAVSHRSRLFAIAEVVLLVMTLAGPLSIYLQFYLVRTR